MTLSGRPESNDKVAAISIVDTLRVRARARFEALLHARLIVISVSSQVGHPWHWTPFNGGATRAEVVATVKRLNAAERSMRAVQPFRPLRGRLHSICC
jgi:hypothetical protein